MSTPLLQPPSRISVVLPFNDIAEFFLDASSAWLIFTGWVLGRWLHLLFLLSRPRMALFHLQQVDLSGIQRLRDIPDPRRQACSIPGDVPALLYCAAYGIDQPARLTMLFKAGKHRLLLALNGRIARSWSSRLRKRGLTSRRSPTLASSMNRTGTNVPFLPGMKRRLHAALLALRPAI